MHVTHELLIDCSNMTAAACSDRCLAALGNSAAFHLKCDMPTDTVHGSVTIAHADLPHPHIVSIECYEVDEAPTAKMSHGVMTGRQSTLECCDHMPTEQELCDRLDTIKDKKV